MSDVYVGLICPECRTHLRSTPRTDSLGWSTQPSHLPATPVGRPPPPPSAPAAPPPLEVTDATADTVVREHEARCFVVGDCVDWWPEVGGNVQGQIERIGSFPFVRVTGTSGVWNASMACPPIGSLMDTSVSPGVVRRIPRPALNERADGCLYFGDIKITSGPMVTVPDSPFDAARQRVEHLSSTMPYPQHFAPAVGSESTALAAPETCGGATRYLRPDGFDQSRVDMLKAAMLAPSVKVK